MATVSAERYFPVGVHKKNHRHMPKPDKVDNLKLAAAFRKREGRSLRDSGKYTTRKVESLLFLSKNCSQLLLPSSPSTAHELGLKLENENPRFMFSRTVRGLAFYKKYQDLGKSRQWVTTIQEMKRVIEILAYSQSRTCRHARKTL